MGKWMKRLVGLGAIALGWSMMILPSRAATEITIKLGVVQQSIPVEDLENFAATGEVSPALQPYRLVLTKDLQNLLAQELETDNRLAQQFLEDLFNSGDGEKLLAQLQTFLPESRPSVLIQTLRDFLARHEAINLLNLIRAYPEQNLSIDLGVIAQWLAKQQLEQVQNELISTALAQDLALEDRAEVPSQLDPTELGEEIVYRQKYLFHDHKRQRAIAADIYLPAKVQGPLVIMSHGFAADRDFLKYLAYHLSSHGFTVVSIEHPGSNIYALVELSKGARLGSLLPPEEFIERPRDISFVLDELEKLNRSNNYMRGKLPTKQVTIIGHSFGGYTALVLAGAQLNPKALRHFCENSPPLGRSPADWLQCAASRLPYRYLAARDSRVVQAMVLNPISGELFAQNLDAVKVPVFMLSSSQDGITPIMAHQLQAFGQLKGEKYLLMALGATHLSVTDISYLDSAMGQSTLVREIMDERADGLRNAVSALSLAFLKQKTAEANLYKPYLTSAYAPSLSNSTIALRLTPELPQESRAWLSLLQPTKPSPNLPPSNLATSTGAFWDDLWLPIEAWFQPPAPKTQYLEPIFGSLLEQYYLDIQGLS